MASKKATKKVDTVRPDLNRSGGCTDLSNMNLPMHTETPISNRRLSRLKDQLQCFNIIYMAAFVVLLILKSYIVVRKFPETTSDMEKLFAVVDVGLMIGTILIFCVLNSEKCFSKSFLTFGILYNIACLIFLAILYFEFEEYEVESHIKLTRLTMLANFVCAFLAVAFLIYTLLKVNSITRGIRRIEKLEKREYLYFNSDNDASLASVEEDSRSHLTMSPTINYSESMPAK